MATWEYSLSNSRDLLLDRPLVSLRWLLGFSRSCLMVPK